MKPGQLHSLCLALCLAAGAPLALAASDMNDSNRVPSQQLPGTGTIDRNGSSGPSGSGTPGDGMGTGDMDGEGVGNPGTGRTTPDVGNPGSSRPSPGVGNPGTGRGTPATPGSSGGTGGGG